MKKMILATLLASVIWFSACSTPTWVITGENIAEAAVPIAGSILDIVDPPLAPVVTLVEGGFTAVVNTLKAYQAAPNATTLQATQSAFIALQANEAALEKAAGATPTLDATINGVLALVAQAVTEIAALIPPPTAGAFGIHIHGRSKGMKANDFKKQFNAITKGDPRFAKRQFHLNPVARVL